MVSVPSQTLSYNSSTRCFHRHIATQLSEALVTATAVKYSELAGHSVEGYHGKQGTVDIANDLNVDIVVVSMKVPDHHTQ